MNQPPLAKTPYSTRLNSLQIVAIYAFLGALWVPVTDQLLAFRISDMEMFTVIQTLKDGVFVMVTAAMLYLLIQRSTQMLLHSEQILREKHAQLNAIIEGSSDAIFIKDVRSRYLMINTAGTSYLAKPRQAILGKTDGELVSPDLARLLTEKDRQVMATGQTLTFEQRLASGKAPQIYSITKSPYQDMQGRTIGMIGIARNITKRKLREKALRQQAQIIDQVHDSVVSTDLDGYVTSWNKGAERLFGYQTEEMLGKPIAYVYPREEHEFLERQVIGVLKAKGQHNVEVRMRRKSGEDFYAHLSLSLLLDDKGSATGMIGYSIDITERKRMEKALRISEERFRVALKNSPIIIFNQDDQLRYTWINKPIPGFSAQQILNRRDADFMERLEDAEIIEKIKQRVLDSGVGTRAEINIHSGGFDHFYDLTVELLQDKSGGRVIGLTGAAFDITQRKLSEEQARQHQAELTHVARLSVAGEMASGLAHELSQPLMIVEMSAKNCLHHIQAHRGHSEDLMIRMEQIVEQGHRALEIIRRMRNFTRKTKLQRTQVDINMLIRDITCFIETEVKRNRINLQFKLADSLPAVFADAIQIQQVVTNLMRNAIEAMQNTEAGKRQLVIQTTPAESDSIEVEIGDTGPGLPAEVESQLFHPFFTTKPNGMGLGLSISKSIIEGHGGRLWATPNLPRGVTFHFTLPVVTQNYTNGELAGTIS